MIFYFQIGLVMLVGLAAKNAILIVEFAKVQVDKGGDLIQSGHPCCPTPFPAYPDDFPRLCIGNASYGVGKRTGLGEPSGHRYGCFLRNDICHCIRYCACTVLLCPGIQDKSQKCSIRLRKTDFKDNVYEKKEHIYYFVAEYVCPYLMQGGQELCASGDGIAG